MTATIRSVSAGEAELLTAIHKECFPHYWNPDAFTDFFAVAGTCALLAETLSLSPPAPPASGRGAAIGMTVYRVQHEQADIITLAVRPAWRRKGIAAALLKKALADTAAMGAKSLFLDVEEGNEAALELYQSHGFTRIGRRKQYYRQKDGSYTDALVMTRKLSVASGQRSV